MASEFSRILTLLRKEKNISQKSAAASLGVSQALLSHYEKGIRECGLEFLVRAANFYDVSCDYMLGRTPDRTGTTLSVEEIPDGDDGSRDQIHLDSMMATLNKKLITNSLHILYETLRKSQCDSLIQEVSNYLMIAVYKMFRIVYSANDKNQDQMFKIPAHMVTSYSNASLEIHQAKANSVAIGKPSTGLDKIPDTEALSMSTESISGDYPAFATSLLNLINTAENSICKIES